MNTFKDLKFVPHPHGEGKMARMFFSNGYGVSVVRFKTFSGDYTSYTSNESEWELAVLYGSEDDWDICYDTPITNDVIGYLDSDGVTNVMKKVQDL